MMMTASSPGVSIAVLAVGVGVRSGMGLERIGRLEPFSIWHGVGADWQVGAVFNMAQAFVDWQVGAGFNLARIGRVDWQRIGRKLSK